MLISLLTYLLISNALSLRKDKSILFSRIVMVSLILTSFLAFNNLFVLTLDKGIGIFGGLFHVTAFTQSFNIFILLISATILTLTSFIQTAVIMYIFKNRILRFFLYLTINTHLLIVIFNVFFSLSCFIYNSSMLEEFFILSKEFNPMDIGNLLNPSENNSSVSGTGGNGNNGGGPSNTGLPKIAPQDNARLSQEDSNMGDPVFIEQNENNKRLGDLLESEVNAILEHRKSCLEAQPYNHGGRTGRISERVELSQLRLSKQDKSDIKAILTNDDLPPHLKSFVQKKAYVNTGIYTKDLKYLLIDYIKNYRTK